jgi:hypothetical protein
LLPHTDNPAALDFEARVVIEQAQAEGRAINQSTREYFKTRFSNAARLFVFPKAGTLWVLISFLYAAIMHRTSIVYGFFTSMLLIFGFVILGLIAVVLETHWLVRQCAEEARMAIEILYSKNVRPTGGEERLEELEKAFSNNFRHSRRCVGLSWGSFEEYKILYHAFFGFQRK